MNHFVQSSHISLRIALLTYSTKPRGSVIHTLELAAALHHAGHQVCVYALDKDGQGFDYNLPCDVQLIPAGPAPQEMDQLIHQRIQEFASFLRQCNPNHDVYHAQDCLSANALTELRSTHTVPCLVRTVHHIENYTSPYLRDCQDRSIREADLCLCVSQHWQDQLLLHYGIDAPRVINGINTQRFRPTSSEQNNELGDAHAAKLCQRFNIHPYSVNRLQRSPVYLTVGGIEPRKNSIRLVQAFAQVLQAHPKAQLVIAGGATLFDYQSYRDEFFAKVECLGLDIGTSLILPGVLSDEDLPMIYRTADAFVFPSIKEGWGMVVLEAIASHLPVIVPQQPPFTEFLSHNQAEWVEPENIDTITQAMRNVIRSNRHQELIAHSQSVLDQYTWEQSAKLHVFEYTKMMVR